MDNAASPAAGQPAAGFDVAAAAAWGRVRLSFVTAEDFGSWAIRAYDHGAFSHVDCVLPDGRYLGARDDELAGVGRGVQIRPAGYTPFARQLLVDIPAPPTLALPFYRFLAAQLGKPYDATGLVANFVLDRDWHQDDAWWCSELQGAALETGILAQRLETPLNKLTPDGLAFTAQGLSYRWR